MIRIFVAEDNDVCRFAVKLAIKQESAMVLVGEACDGAGVAELVITSETDVAILDLRMPGEDGISLTRKIKARRPDIRVLISSSYDDRTTILNAQEAGAAGYVVKHVSMNELIQAVKAVALGGTWFEPDLAKPLVESDPSV